MRKSKINITSIVTDIDGTILNDKGTISSKNINAINKIRRKGIKLFFASGRMPISIKNFIRSFTSEEYPIISFNGGMIEVDKNIIFNSTLNHKEIIKIVEESLKRNYYIQAYNKNELIVPLDYKESRDYSIHAGIDFMVKTDFLDFIRNIELNKCLIIDDNKVITSIKKEYEKKYLQTEFVISDNKYLDILPKGINKGTAADTLCHYFGLKTSNMVAIGDNDNDIPMFERAGISVAMKNSSEEIKKQVDIVVPSNNESGFAYIIDKLLEE